MRSDIYESVWFTLGTVIDTFEICVFIQVQLTLTLI